MASKEEELKNKFKETIAKQKKNCLKRIQFSYSLNHRKNIADSGIISTLIK